MISMCMLTMPEALVLICAINYVGAMRKYVLMEEDL